MSRLEQIDIGAATPLADAPGGMAYARKRDALFLDLVLAAKPSPAVRKGVTAVQAAIGAFAVLCLILAGIAGSGV